MACCKCCCGNKDCAEGDHGKCCCGGSAGACCTASQYCCSGVCQSAPCGECSGTCAIEAEVVWYQNLTGTYLQHDGDSFPSCNENGSTHRPLPEVISGTFTLGTASGCGSVSCGCELKFRFWRNLYSLCNNGSNSDITTQTVVVACTAGAVKVRTSGGDVPLSAGGSHAFSAIGFDSAQGSVNTSSAGECFSVAANSVTAAFTVTATLNWSNGTDHDLYGTISCGSCQ